jgi:hypothetical protein
MGNWIGRFAVGLALVVAPSTALAWDEAVDGELSADPAAPTPVTFNVGNNTVTGTVRSTAPVDIRDYITFTIPPGRTLTALRLINYADLSGTGQGVTGFHAINAGATSFIPDLTTENNFLGGDHVIPMASGTDLLPELSDGDTAGTGFTVPLGPGTYTYVIQQTSGFVGYNMQFVISGPAPVPTWQPWAAVLMAGLLAAAGFIVVRRRALGIS